MNTIRTQDWRRDNRRRRESVTQAWGWAFAAAGCEGIMVPSAATTGQNLIVGIVFATDIIIIVPSLYLVLEDVKTQLAPRRQQPTRQPQLAEHS